MRELLDSSRIDEPTEQQLGELTQRLGLLFTLPPGGGAGSGPAGHGGSPPSGTGGAGISGAPTLGGGAAVATASVATKVLVGAVAVASLGGAVWTGAVLLRPPPSSDAPALAVVPPTLSAPPAAAPPAPPAQPREAEAEPPPAQPPRASPPRPRSSPQRAAPHERSPTGASVDAPDEAAHPTPPPAPSPALPGDDELDLLQGAVAAAHDGRPQQVLEAVEQHIARFPHSAMAQEREVLAIEALVSLGRTSEAKERVARFRTRWPTSGHLLHLESLVP
jgi:hypothetical protein